jgi:hypothetical protein
VRSRKAHGVVENDDWDEDAMMTVLSFIWLSQSLISCLTLMPMNLNCPLQTLSVLVENSAVDPAADSANTYVHAGVVIEVYTQPGFRNHLKSLMKQKSRRLRRDMQSAPLPPTPIVMKNPSQRSDLMVRLVAHRLTLWNVPEAMLFRQTGQPIVEPEVDLSAFLARQRLEDLPEPLLVPARVDEDDVDHSLAHLTSNSLTDRQSRKGKARQIEWDASLEEMQHDKSVAQAQSGAYHISVS